ncbi:hypothetical protein QAD02_014601 [Eretmocerus hayati]|uniref:Uncharacterized protein n=1 Tax=Eretmocerus hayati TaxID=131215 RepID=A0ACC2P883_9HYME|nr:hypothetical protein QAD02_014601 [Eretmocerus hayati]
MSFSIENYKNCNFPSFNKPEIVGYFSLNTQSRLYSQDLSQLKYYNGATIRGSKTKVNLNLSEGINQVIRKPGNLNEKIDHLLQWITENHETIKASPDQNRWLRPDFVCFRGLLTRICSTPYNDQEDWIICAAKFQGTIYLCAFDTEEQKHKFANMSEKNLKFMSWGFKFEQFLLSETPNGTPITTKPVNEAEEFCCLYKSKLGKNTLFYGAEMDGVCSSQPLQEPIDWKTKKFVELKTNRMVKTDWQEKIYKKKLLKWWCQSFLVGIEDVICGNRTDSGKVFEIENIKVSDMPKICQDFWNPCDSMNFCNKFLDHIVAVVSQDYQEAIYKFDFKVGEGMRLEVLPPSSKYFFLPNWFTQKVDEMIKKTKTIGRCDDQGLETCS